MNLSKRKRDELEAMEFEQVYLTPKGAERLAEKLAQLKRALPERAAEVKRTSDYGDRSENFEYKQAKSFLRRTQAEIFRIEDQLKRVATIPHGKNAAGTVQLGSTIVIESTREGAKKTFEIVGPMETNPARGRISNVSPLGAALIGHRVDDLVTIPTGTGAIEYRILEIK
jgi:transcription elongation factor GreA